jgi:hypothetical protein
MRVWEPEGKRTSVTIEPKMGSFVMQRWSLERITDDGMKVWEPAEKMWLTEDCIRTLFGDEALRYVKGE